MSRVGGSVVDRARWITAIAVFALLGAVATAAMAGLAKPTTVTTHQTKRGKMLAAANGHALYLFSADGASKSTCSGTCANTWKPLLTSSRPSAARGSGVDDKLLGTARRSGQTLQATYNGHPLYTFVKDKSAGEISGEGANQFHGHWYIVNTSGNAVKPKASGGGGGLCNPICQGY